ncbi:MAG: secondary thiamine-phosphate synthase enzyme YjbQ [Rhodanobacteraceae bacterium]
MAIKPAVPMNADKTSHLSQASIAVATPGRGLVDVSTQVGNAVRASGLWTGVAQIFLHHTSCSLLLGENADPTVCADLERFFTRLVPDGDPLFKHTAEGPDDMPAHVRSALTGASLSIPVADGALDLGTWQGIFLFEHRTSPHQRRLTVTTIGQ